MVVAEVCSCLASSWHVFAHLRDEFFSCCRTGSPEWCHYVEKFSPQITACYNKFQSFSTLTEPPRQFLLVVLFRILFFVITRNSAKVSCHIFFSNFKRKYWQFQTQRILFFWIGPHSGPLWHFKVVFTFLGIIITWIFLISTPCSIWLANTSDFLTESSKHSPVLCVL